MLWSWSFIESIEDSDDDKFNAFGPGRVLNPPPSLEGADFNEFKRRIANFSLGFREITDDPFLPRMRALAGEFGSFELVDEYVATMPIPGEVTNARELVEGTACLVTVNAFERNAEARRQCVEHYGIRCVVCEFDFGSVYGPISKGIIHVHHLTPLSTVRKGYVVDPVTDMRPVCPNCHAVIHQGGGCRTIEEVKQLIATGCVA